jgi:predicted RNA-binding protein with EMAP domain
MDASTTYLYHNGSNKFYTSSAGVTVNGTLNETSALALKENIEPITNSLSIINDLQGVKYDWKDKENFEDRRQIGLIAENVKEVIPEAESDGSVTYTKLVGLLIEGIKDLNKEVNELKAKING